MNLIQRIHGYNIDHDYLHENESHSHNIPFWVRHYDKIVNLITLGRTNTIHQQTLALAGLRAGDAVLDIGCGTGALVLEAKNVVGHNGTAVGLDIEPAMIEQATRRASRKHSQAIFEIASIEQIPYPDNTFDVAISSLMYHHLTESQKTEGLGELKRVLKSDGRLLVIDLNPSRRSILTSLPGHNQLDRQDYVRDEVTVQMQTAGFTGIKAGPHPYKPLSYAIGQKA
jgi:ubiquinone/menaquinone biosynthesis C-methylase UbiE